MNQKKKKIQPYAAYKRLTNFKNTCRLKVKGSKTIFYANGKQKKRCGYFYIRHNGLKVENCHKRQKRSLYDNKWTDSSRGYNKYTCTQHWRP